jgi:hypothetical protein
LSTTVVVDGGVGGMEQTAPIIFVDSGSKDAIAAAPLTTAAVNDDRHHRLR